MVFADEIHAAARVRKTHATSGHTFASANGGPLGYVVEGPGRLLNHPTSRTTIPAAGEPRPVLAAIRAIGYRTFPVDVVDRKGASLGDFVGLAVEDDDVGKDLHFSNGAQFWNFAVTSRVVHALTQASVTELSITPA